MKNTILTILWLLIFAACEKESFIPEPRYNAEILSFDGRKCYCMYGYMIKMGEDTILSTSTVLFERFGHEITEPIKVNIQIENIEEYCKYPYCEVVTIDTGIDGKYRD